jgi:hypothetical protein
MSSTSTRKSGRRSEPPRAIAVALLVAALGACAENSSAIRDPGEEKRALTCAHDETLSCVEKMGKVVSCTCSSRDDLRRILEPEKH